MVTNRTGEHRRHSVLQTFRRRWKVALAITSLITVIAVAAALIRTPIYTAEARLAVGSGEMTALNIPGFPTASEEMASNYARWITHQGVEGHGRPEGTASLEASPIVDSNVLRIEATSTDPAVAVQAAQESAEHLTEAVNQVSDENNPEAILEQIEANIAPLTLARRANQTAQQRYDDALEGGASTAVLESRLQDYVDSQSTLVALDLGQNGLQDRYRRLVGTRSTEAQLHEVSAAHLVGDDSMAILQRNGLLGLLLGGALAWGAVNVLERRRKDDADGDGTVLPADDDMAASPVEPAGSSEQPEDQAAEVGDAIWREARVGGVPDEDEHVAFVDARTG